MEQYVIDTHPLLWYVSADNRIGSQAKTVMDKAEAGEISIIVPAIVLIEAIEVIKKGKVIYDLDDFLLQIHQRNNFIIKNLDWETITLFKDYTPLIPKDSHDKIIIITAQHCGNIPIITKDEDIQQVYSPTIW